MMRSMYAGVSGLKCHQTKMDVIGNNISNVNTTGFKGSRVTFTEMLNQTIQGAKAPQDDRGGMNPKQVGLGVSVGSIDTNMETGNLQSTGVGTDLAIEGNGFFVVNNGNRNFYTRAGALSLDNDGNLVNAANGYIMQGWTADTEGNISTNESPEGLSIPVGDTMPGEATEEAIFGGNLDSNCDDGITRTATRDVYDSLGGLHTLSLEFTRRVPNSTDTIGPMNLTMTATGPDENLNNFNIDFGADNDGDLTATYNGTDTITLQADWDDSNSGAPDDLAAIESVINSTLEDEGFDKQLSLSLDDPTNYDAGSFAGAGFLTLSNPTERTWDWEVTDVTDASVFSGSGTVEFSTDGSINTGGTGNITFDPQGGAALGQSVQLDFSTLGQRAGAYTIEGLDSDGYAIGSLNSFSIDNAGIITGTYSNGLNQSLGQVAVASFNNASGLTKKAGSLYVPSQNSGMAQIGEAGNGGRGKISAGSLEMSNVDLAKQFTEMITSQRGFQANSKSITTADEMLQELVNLKR